MTESENAGRIGKGAGGGLSRREFLAGSALTAVGFGEAALPCRTAGPPRRL